MTISSKRIFRKKKTRSPIIVYVAGVDIKNNPYSGYACGWKTETSSKAPGQREDSFLKVVLRKWIRSAKENPTVTENSIIRFSSMRAADGSLEVALVAESLVEPTEIETP